LKLETRNSKLKHDIRDVVLLHGWGSSASVWGGLLALLAPRLRVSAPDLPGYGSNRPCEPCTAERMADAIALTAPPRCHVVGWSLGGLVALAWAALAPRQVARLALIAATPSFLRRPGWPDAMSAESFAAFEEATAADPARALRRFASLQAQGDASAKQVARQLRGALATGAAALGAGLGVLRETDLREKLHALSPPALVVHGARDRLVPPAAGERLASLLPGARLLMLPGAAHAPFLSQPAPVAAALVDHFDA
jgi:pimeloyl-[acyl-carrier protein] methyl ester esterase